MLLETSCTWKESGITGSGNGFSSTCAVVVQYLCSTVYSAVEGEGR